MNIVDQLREQIINTAWNCIIDTPNVSHDRLTRPVWHIETTYAGHKWRMGLISEHVRCMPTTNDHNPMCCCDRGCKISRFTPNGRESTFTTYEIRKDSDTATADTPESMLARVIYPDNKSFEPNTRDIDGEELAWLLSVVNNANWVPCEVQHKI